MQGILIKADHPDKNGNIYPFEVLEASVTSMMSLPVTIGQDRLVFGKVIDARMINEGGYVYINISFKNIKKGRKR